MKNVHRGRLSLHKETLRTLHASKLRGVAGGLNILSLLGEHCLLTQQTCLDSCELKPYPSSAC